MAFGQWLRKNAQKYLLEAADNGMIARYPESCAKPYRDSSFSSFLWRSIFVPVYLAIPWSVRKKIILQTSYPSGKRPKWKKYD